MRCTILIFFLRDRRRRSVWRSVGGCIEIACYSTYSIPADPTVFYRASVWWALTPSRLVCGPRAATMRTGFMTSVVDTVVTGPRRGSPAGAWLPLNASSPSKARERRLGQALRPVLLHPLPPDARRSRAMQSTWAL
eukprot:COSAG02_NODE_2444_length_8852_cov_3.142008_5_plen_136_part_00